MHIHTETVNNALKRNGFKGRLVAHGFRSIASTYLNEMGINSDWIETCLAHTSKNKVRDAYNRALYFDQRTGVMQRWSILLFNNGNENELIEFFNIHFDANDFDVKVLKSDPQISDDKYLVAHVRNNSNA